MELGGDDFNGFKTGRAEMFGNPMSGALDVGFMLAFGADRRDAEECEEFGKMLLATTFNKLNEIHKLPSGTTVRFRGKTYNFRENAAEWLRSKKRMP
jgi:hypothetical protein